MNRGCVVSLALWLVSPTQAMATTNDVFNFPPSRAQSSPAKSRSSVSVQVWLCAGGLRDPPFLAADT
ncbi:unnamed protein product [Protopolystoma xenopodis]|uniref:Uncharacterized protein n=1 Tax=Protopolystoma xenopodis TaxID=117903 RepID=A0A448WLS8_9PLAT|nr:unnamed protein product [Protopolystoma xenopodis]